MTDINLRAILSLFVLLTACGELDFDHRPIALDPCESREVEQCGDAPCELSARLSPSETGFEVAFFPVGFDTDAMSRFEAQVDELLSDLTTAGPRGLVSRAPGSFSFSRIRALRRDGGAPDFGLCGDTTRPGAPLLHVDGGAEALVQTLMPSVDVIVFVTNTRDGRANATLRRTHDQLAAIRLNLDDDASVLEHELGHALIGLEDEYDDLEGCYPDAGHTNELFGVSNLTLDPSGEKWSDLVSGAQPGGARWDSCVYHPTERCRMLSSRHEHFCPVCEAAIDEVLAPVQGRNRPPDCRLDVDASSTTAHAAAFDRTGGLQLDLRVDGHPIQTGPVDGAAWQTRQELALGALRPGQHTATLRCRDARGLESHAALTFTVDAPPGPPSACVAPPANPWFPKSEVTSSASALDDPLAPFSVAIVSAGFSEERMEEFRRAAHWLLSDAGSDPAGVIGRARANFRFTVIEMPDDRDGLGQPNGLRACATGDDGASLTVDTERLELLLETEAHSPSLVIVLVNGEGKPSLRRLMRGDRVVPVLIAPDDIDHHQLDRLLAEGWIGLASESGGLDSCYEPELPPGYVVSVGGDAFGRRNISIQSESPKWHDLVDGAIAGGEGHDRCAYHATRSCVMGDASQGAFCVVCERAIDEAVLGDAAPGNPPPDCELLGSKPFDRFEGGTLGLRAYDRSWRHRSLPPRIEVRVEVDGQRAFFNVGGGRSNVLSLRPGELFELTEMDLGRQQLVRVSCTDARGATTSIEQLISL